MNDLITLTPQQPDCSETSNHDRLLLIDGDGISYMIGWNYRDFIYDETIIENVALAIRRAVDTFMKEFFTLVGCSTYLGVLSSESNRKNFRYSLYKYKPYKGNRQEDPDWVKTWKPIINQHLIDAWKFVRAPEHLETDDIIAGLQLDIHNRLGIAATTVCSPDKDLKQLPGQHYCYKTQKQDIVSYEKALWNWCMQMLCGDDTDNIAGLPGLGPKKAEALLKTGNSWTWIVQVQCAYQKYFGNYYGSIIYEETEGVITLMNPSHPLWETYGFEIDEYKNQICNFAG